MPHWTKNKLRKYLHFSYTTVVFWIIVFSATLFRLFLGINTLLVARADMPHDDGLAINQIISIFNRGWLGSWSDKTLIKGCIYPVFAGTLSRLGIPYLLGLYALYICSVALIIVSLKPLLKNRWTLLLLYIALLYSPVMFNYNTVQRIYRNAIIPAASLMVAGSYIGIFFRRNSIKQLFIWSILAGLSLSFFYFICENSIWLGLFAIGASVATIFYGLIEAKSLKFRAALCFLLIPLLCLYCTRAVISAKNNHVYGADYLNSRTDTSFNDMMAQLLLIERHEDDSDLNYWITWNMLEDSFAASPSLNTIRTYAETYYNYWDINFSAAGDYTQWILLDAMEEAGLCESPERMEEFCSAVTKELMVAFENGTLHKTDKSQLRLSSYMRGISFEDVPELFSCFFTSLRVMISYEKCQSMYTYSLGDPSTITELAGVFKTSNLMVASIKPGSVISGWLFAYDSDDSLRAFLVDQEGNQIEELSFYESEDVLAAYPQYAAAEMARFKISVPNAGEIYSIAVYLNDELVGTVVADSAHTYYGGLFRLNFEYVNAAENQTESLITNRLTYPVQTISNTCIKIYQLLSVPTAVLGTLGYVIVIKRSFFGGERRERSCSRQLCLMLTGLILCVFALAAGNGWFMSFMDDSVYLSWITNYCAGGMVLLRVFFGIGLMVLVDWGRVLFRKIA